MKKTVPILGIVFILISITGTAYAYVARWGLEEAFEYFGTLIIILLLGIGYFLVRNSLKLRAKNKEVNYWNELHKTFIDADKGLIYLKDQDLKYIFVNKAVERFYNRKASEIIGYDDYDLTVKEFADYRRKTDLDVKEKRALVVDQVKWENKIYQTTKFPVKLPSGQFGVGAYIKDITEEYYNKEKLISANALLEANEERLRLILDSTAEAIYGIDTNGNCTFANASCLNILGYQREEDLLGENMHWKIHYKDANGRKIPMEECLIFKSFSEGKPAHMEDEILWKADGTSFPAEYSSYPQYKNGIIVGAVVTFSDITERKKAQDQILEGKKELERANRELQDKQYQLEEQNAMVEELNSQLEEENQRYHQQKEILQAIIDSLGGG